ncbi:tip elongation aberrant protein 1 [Austrofundulus limnaeus]|uniref:Tip elongation aberrant protein 1 n=1 Tax=Austrofundulus limnaeus TaxID=52670 RepID=A0A2I4CR75_AUSLI|nr:PREDICTED: tip elongation aberrant protein 1-like [Austrofundulus limnaeus]
MSHSNPSLWTQLPQSQQSPCDRYKHACCSYSGHVYVLGGRDSSGVGDFWKYSVVCDEWTELNCTSDAAPEQLEEHSMVAHEGFLYVFGGRLDSAYSTCAGALWVFNVAKQKWVHCQEKRSSPQRPSNRKGHSAVVIGETMFIYGGFVDVKGPSQELWGLHFGTSGWSLLSHPDSSSPGPRHSHCAVAYRGSMFLFGGLKGLREQRDFWEWNSSSQTWTCLKTKSGPPRLMGHSAVVYRDSMLLFGGGETQNFPQNRLWRYSFPTNTWTQVASLTCSSPPDKIHHCCTGLGPSFTPTCCWSSSEPTQQDQKHRPFRNRCSPAAQVFLGSRCDIELKTFSQNIRLSSAELDQTSGTGTCPQNRGTHLTCENQALKKQWSCTAEELLDQEEEEDEDICKHLPDLLLVLGGRPYSRNSPISVWQMTLTDP